MNQDTTQLIVTSILFIYGLANVIAPQQVFELRKKIVSLFGVKMSGNKVTWNYYRVMGILFIIIAISIWI